MLQLAYEKDKSYWDELFRGSKIETHWSFTCPINDLKDEYNNLNVGGKDTHPIRIPVVNNKT